MYPLDKWNAILLLALAFAYMWRKQESTHTSQTSQQVQYIVLLAE